MENQPLSIIRQRLMVERSATVKLLQKQDLHPADDGDLGFSPPPTHGQDDEAERVAFLEINFAQTGSLQDYLKEIDLALSKCDAGSYGICDSCQAAISPARLDINPTARFCINCKRKLEENG